MFMSPQLSEVEREFGRFFVYMVKEDHKCGEKKITSSGGKYHMFVFVCFDEHGGRFLKMKRKNKVGHGWAGVLSQFFSFFNF